MSTKISTMIIMKVMHVREYTMLSNHYTKCQFKDIADLMRKNIKKL